MQDKRRTKMRVHKDGIDSLPRPLFLEILSLLPLRDVGQMMLVNHEYYKRLREHLNKTAHNNILSIPNRDDVESNYREDGSYVQRYLNTVKKCAVSTEYEKIASFWQIHQKGIIDVLSLNSDMRSFNNGIFFLKQAIKYDCSQLFVYLLSEKIVTRAPQIKTMQRHFRIAFFKYPKIELPPCIYLGVEWDDGEGMIAAVKHIHQYMRHEPKSDFHSVLMKYLDRAFTQCREDVFVQIIRSDRLKYDAMIDQNSTIDRILNVLCHNKRVGEWIKHIPPLRCRHGIYNISKHPLSLALEANNIHALEYLIKHRILPPGSSSQLIFAYCDKNPPHQHLAEMMFKYVYPLHIPEDMGSQYSGNQYLTELLQNPPAHVSPYVQFEHACINGDLQQVKSLLKQHDFLMAGFRHYQCEPLSRALEHGKTEIVLLLLKCNLSFKLQQYHDFTMKDAALLAVINGHTKTVRKLIKTGYLKDSRAIMLYAAKAMLIDVNPTMFNTLIHTPQCDVNTVLEMARHIVASNKDTDESRGVAYNAIRQHPRFEPAYFTLDKIVQFYNEGWHELVKLFIKDPRVAIECSKNHNQLIAAVIEKKDTTMLKCILDAGKLVAKEITPNGEHILIAECVHDEGLFMTVYNHPDHGLEHADTAYLLDNARSPKVVEKIFTTHSRLTPRQLLHVLYFLGDSKTSTLLHKGIITLIDTTPETLETLTHRFITDAILQDIQPEGEPYHYREFIDYMNNTLQVNWNNVDNTGQSALHYAISHKNSALLQKLVKFESLQFPVHENLFSRCFTQFLKSTQQLHSLKLLQQKAHATLSSNKLFQLYNGLNDAGLSLSYILTLRGDSEILEIALPYFQVDLLTSTNENLLLCAIHSKKIAHVKLLLDADFSLLERYDIDKTLTEILRLCNPSTFQALVIKTLLNHSNQYVWNRRRVQHLCIRVACLQSDENIVELLGEQVSIFYHGPSSTADSSKSYLKAFQTQCHSAMFGNVVKAVDKKFIEKMQMLCNKYLQGQYKKVAMPSHKA